MALTKRAVVLCADDFGLSEAVSAGIIDLADMGRISATSAMTNCPAWRRTGPDLRSRAGRIGVGLHFNLTSGAPLGPMPVWAPRGALPGIGEAIRRALMDHAVQRRVALSHELKDRLGRDYAVATGVHDVADAFVRGQVDTLLVDPRAAADLTLDLSQHPGLVVSASTPDEPLPAVPALVGAAVLTSAQVAVTRAATLGGSPVAALLRWDQDAVGSDNR